MIETVQLFPILDKKLIDLLRSLNPEDWNRKTVAKLWTVKDIAAHLLDGNIRTLSLSRDKHYQDPGTEIGSYDQLLNYLNRLNAEWVTAMKRLSSEMLIELLEITGREYSDFIARLDPEADAIFSVEWAGEHVSKNWFHIAREYTEKWHHQQQIREATGKPGIMTRELFFPVMDTFICGLPHTYRNTTAPNGTTIAMIVESEIGGKWFLVRSGDTWKIRLDNQKDIDAAVTLKPDTAWKLFTKAISPEQAMKNAVVEGKEDLASVALKLIAVMA